MDWSKTNLLVLKYWCSSILYSIHAYSSAEVLIWFVKEFDAGYSISKKNFMLPLFSKACAVLHVCGITGNGTKTTLNKVSNIEIFVIVVKSRV